MQKDSLQRFIFKNRAVRGCLVRLNESYQTITLQHHYPAVLSKLLGETLLGVVLMSSHFKQRGQATLQFQGDGALKLLSARVTADHAIRGLVRAEPDLISNQNLIQALHQGQLTLSYEDLQSGQNYQSIIPVEAPSIADALAHYFVRSEQVPTRFFLASTEKTAVGLLLQIMPSKDPLIARDDFQHLTVLADTLKDSELLTLSFEEILTRLYHEEDIEIFPEISLHFGCNCTLEKMEQVVKSLGLSEAEAILSAHSFVEVTCEFCNQIHRFDQRDLDRIFK
ncbi:MAG: Hsp33 family molecular chaperone HslO [Gammaproteobacteria bacterium]|jgi:molecular chaperone Hsp33|nr:Hsp33 family molecular chaperone HslO [Gammaproteobacteria bacterium]